MQVQPAKKRKGIYKFVTHEDLTYTTHLLGYEYENERFRIEPDGTVTVIGSYSDGYAWDGCTPKWNFLDLVLIGIPDGRVIVNTKKPITYYASLIHDILLQHRDDIDLPRKEADKVFLHYLGDFSLRHVYYFFVRAYGELVGVVEKVVGK